MNRNQNRAGALSSPMELPIRPKDLKLIFAGAAAAVLVGLGAGALMHPSLGEPPDAAPPERSLRTVERNDPGVSVYRGRMPEYVMGTDRTRQAHLDYAETVAEPEPEPETSDAAAPPEPPAWRPGPLGGWEATEGGPTVEEGIARDPTPPAEGEDQG